MLKRVYNKIYRDVYNPILYREKRYNPTIFEEPERLLNQKTAWKGLELIIKDIIEFSKIETKNCLEFGVEYGFSTSAFSNYFDEVTGVDIFTGDLHTGEYESIYEEVSLSLKPFPNVHLIKADYRDFIKNPTRDFYDLIHVDIIHTYAATFECGLWSAKHSNVTLFHDTESFPEVKRAVADIAKQTNKKFYNYKECYGLGIIL